MVFVFHVRFKKFKPEIIVYITSGFFNSFTHHSFPHNTNCNNKLTVNNEQPSLWKNSVNSFDFNDPSFWSHHTDKSEFELRSTLDNHGESDKNSSIDSTITDTDCSMIANKTK